MKEQRKLTDRSQKLLDSHLEGTVPPDLYRQEQTRINEKLERITEKLGALDVHFETRDRGLEDALDVMSRDVVSATRP